jgi:hypothetical protein
MRLLIATTLTLLVALPALAAPLRVTVSRSQITTDEVVIISVQAEGNDFGEPVFEENGDWRISPRPIRQSKNYSVQIINGSISRLYTSTMMFEARPLKEGTLVIPSVQMEVDGNVEKSAPIPVQVMEGDPDPSIGNSSSPSGSSNNADPVTFEDTVILEAQLSKNSVFAGEEVTLTVALYELLHSGVRMRLARPLTWPEAEGFYKSEVDTLPEARDTRSGRQYLMRSFVQTLYPTRPGTLSIGGAEWEGDVYAYTDRGRDRRRVIKKTDPMTLTVKALPPAPPEFTGAVGRYQLSAAIQGGAITQGIPFDLNVTVRGRGNPEAITAPDLPELPWAHVSAPSSDVNAVSGTNDLEKVFTYSVVPTEEGEHIIPPVQFTFFAPEITQYKTRESGNIKVLVLESEESGEMVVAGGSSGKGAGAGFTDDIRPIRTSVPRLRPQRGTGLTEGALVLFPPLAFAGCFAFVRRQRRFREDTSYARSYFARSKSHKRLKAVRSSKAPVEALSKALIGYLADKLDVPEAGLTSHDVEKLLRETTVDEDTRTAIVRVLRTCEREQYAAVKLRPEEQQALIDAGEHALENLIDTLETRGRKRT